jgi:hypothetical protein
MEASDYKWFKEWLIPNLLEEEAYKCLAKGKISDPEMFRIIHIYCERNY